MLLTSHRSASRTGTVSGPATVRMVIGCGIRPWSGSRPAWVRWCRQANASPRFPVSSTHSCTPVTGGGASRVGSVRITGKTTVQYVSGGVRVASVHWWNGKRSMNSGIAASIQGHRPERDLGLLRLDAEDDELLPLEPLVEALLVQRVLLSGEAHLPVPLVGDPLAGPLGVQLRQVPQERLQCLLLRVGHLLGAHQSPSLFSLRL